MTFASALRDSLVALSSFSLLFVSACGGGGGGDCRAACGEKAACGAVGSHLTALSALAAGQTVAPGIIGGTAKWVGAIEGLEITHDGTPKQTADSVVVGIDLYISGWVFKYCSGMDELVFGAGPKTSSVEKGCGTLNCDALMTYTLPMVDSNQAIATAFPADPADALYKVDLNLLTGTRTWAIAKNGGATVNIDADTGALAP